jgi:type I restriction enzyme S subunit
MAKKKVASESLFVPVEEQPYPIPKNWCWVRLKDVSEIIMGQSPIGSDTTDDSSYMPLIGGAADMGEIYPLATRYTKAPTKISKNGDLILCIRATLGKPIFSDGEYCLGRGVSAIRPYIGTKEFYRYIFLTFEQYLYDNATGTTFAQVSSKTLQKMSVPFPPLPEQHRIVSRIESLFTKLDEAKEKAQAVVDGFELRKSAILHKAFTGELLGLSGSKTIPLEAIVGTIRIGPFGSVLHKEDYIAGGIPVINPKHITNQQIAPEGKVTISEEKALELAAYRLKTGDIIMGRRGEMGRSAPITEKENGWLCGTGSLIIRLQEGYIAAFYSQIIASHSSVQYLEENCVGSTMKNLNEKVIKSLPVPSYTKEQQEAIVAILNSLLEKEQQAKSAAEAVLTQIDSMKKAILVRAFRGELGTNDPSEEWAGELLKAML